MTSTPVTRGRYRVYEGLRTAHLERFHALEPATVLYASTSYDFDESRLSGLAVQRYVGVRDLFVRLLRTEVAELEINEPLMLSGVKGGLVAVAAARLGGLLRRRRTTVVVYAIENLDPFASRSRRLRTPWRRRLFRLAVRVLMSQVDRIVLGTGGAGAAYGWLLRGFAGEVASIPALPTACEVCPSAAGKDRETRVVFVGAFDHRKGLSQLLDAWPAVVAAVPGTTLTILGKGELVGLVREAAAAREEVSLAEDPGRQEIHRVLRTSSTLVLMSQPSLTWREQVGLPIVEGLSHGCEIVASTETGLAEWLAGHGHRVLDPRGTSPAELARAIAESLTGARTAAQVVADLPEVDGRLAADRWMFASSGPVGDAQSRAARRHSRPKRSAVKRRS